MSIRCRIPFGAKRVFATVGLVCLVATAADSQTVDPRWSPWIGCWEPIGDDDREDFLCILPSDEVGAVEVLRFSGKEVQRRDAIRANGDRNRIDRQGCEGWQTNSFSSDNHRVYLTSEYECGGNYSVAQSQIMAFRGAKEWLGIRVIDQDGERSVLTQRYGHVVDERIWITGFGDILAQHDSTARYSRLQSAMALSLEDVIEATQNASPEAVKVLFAALGFDFSLNVEEVNRLFSAGVPEDVIDVIVAVSYPEWFSTDVVEVEGLGELREPKREHPMLLAPFRFGRLPNVWGSGAGYRHTVVTVDMIGKNRGPDERGFAIRWDGRLECKGYELCGDFRNADNLWQHDTDGHHRSGDDEASSYGRSSSGDSSTGRTAKPRGGSSS